MSTIKKGDTVYYVEYDGVKTAKVIKSFVPDCFEVRPYECSYVIREAAYNLYLDPKDLLAEMEKQVQQDIERLTRKLEVIRKQVNELVEYGEKG